MGYNDVHVQLECNLGKFGNKILTLSWQSKTKSKGTIQGIQPQQTLKSDTIFTQENLDIMDIEPSSKTKKSQIK